MIPSSDDCRGLRTDLNEERLMIRSKGSLSLAAGVVMLALLLALPGLAAAAPIIPAGWTCSEGGNCGTLGPDGVVTAPPGGSTYQYVSTSGAPTFSGLNLGFNETNGSLLTTSAFSASGTTVLAFNFNFVTSDGAGFPEYAYAQLAPSGGSPILLFTARTCETTPCNTVPGVGMPPLGVGVTLVPPSTPVTPNATTWSALGSSSGSCWAVGCGNSGWIQAEYTPAAGAYALQFGVVNVNDQAFDTGMAIAGATIGDIPIGDDLAVVPEPTTLILFGSTMAGLGFASRWRRRRLN